jgi:hypothetical protein
VKACETRESIPGGHSQDHSPPRKQGDIFVTVAAPLLPCLRGGLWHNAPNTVRHAFLPNVGPTDALPYHLDDLRNVVAGG